MRIGESHGHNLKLAEKRPRSAVAAKRRWRTVAAGADQRDREIVESEHETVRQFMTYPRVQEIVTLGEKDHVDYVNLILTGTRKDFTKWHREPCVSALFLVARDDHRRCSGTLTVPPQPPRWREPDQSYPQRS